MHGGDVGIICRKIEISSLGVRECVPKPQDETRSINGVVLSSERMSKKHQGLG